LAERLLDLCGRELHRPLSFRLVSPGIVRRERPTVVCSLPFVLAAPSTL
jgi:hypothetical protein